MAAPLWQCFWRVTPLPAPPAPVVAVPACWTPCGRSTCPASTSARAGPDRARAAAVDPRIGVGRALVDSAVVAGTTTECALFVAVLTAGATARRERRAAPGGPHGAVGTVPLVLLVLFLRRRTVDGPTAGAAT